MSKWYKVEALGWSSLAKGSSIHTAIGRGMRSILGDPGARKEARELFAEGWSVDISIRPQTDNEVAEWRAERDKPDDEVGS